MQEYNAFFLLMFCYKLDTRLPSTEYYQWNRDMANMRLCERYRFTSSNKRSRKDITYLGLKSPCLDCCSLHT
jgi:hypothetical protein